MTMERPAVEQGQTTQLFCKVAIVTPFEGKAKVRILGLPAKVTTQELELTKALITLGKPGVQVAVISRRPHGYFLTHIEGDGKNANFPVVNGAPIGPQAYAMKSGDIIELASIKMEFTLTR